MRHNLKIKTQAVQITSRSLQKKKAQQLDSLNIIVAAATMMTSYELINNYT